MTINCIFNKFNHFYSWSQKHPVAAGTAITGIVLTVLASVAYGRKFFGADRNMQPATAPDNGNPILRISPRVPPEAPLYGAKNNKSFTISERTGEEMCYLREKQKFSPGWTPFSVDSSPATQFMKFGVILEPNNPDPSAQLIRILQNSTDFIVNQKPHISELEISAAESESSVSRIHGNVKNPLTITKAHISDYTNLKTISVFGCSLINNTTLSEDVANIFKSKRSVSSHYILYEKNEN